MSSTSVEFDTRKTGTAGRGRFGVIGIGLLLMLIGPAVGAVHGAISETKASLLCDLRSPALTASAAERAFEKDRVMLISSYDDDPFAADSIVECLAYSGFARDADGRLLLDNGRVSVGEESRIYRKDPTGMFRAFAWNPWPIIPTANTDGSFRFPDEPRFPSFEVERDANGRPVLVDGLQVWKPLDLHRGGTTAFEAANKVKDAAEDWAGRPVDWGVDGMLLIEPHAFIDFNAFYSPSTRMLFFGVLPYRLPGTTAIKMFETATDWEMAAHESGHAVHHGLKPNVDLVDPGFNTWGESFADQMTMWTSLRDPGRVRGLLGGPDADLSASNALSRMGEAFGALVGGVALRDAVNDATVSTTPDEVHDRSEVLTGAVYRLFVDILGDLRRQNSEHALERAGLAMGTFLARSTDYTPENRMTLEDVGQAYLKVDKEFFGGRYRDRLVDEFMRREIFDAGSLARWLAHEAAVPGLRLAPGKSERDAAEFVRRNLDRLAVGPDFGLAVQSVTRDERFHQTIVRVQLTLGRDAGAVPLANHGILVFRADGTLADYHAPLAPDISQAEGVALLDEARRLGLDGHGAPLSIVRAPDGHPTVEAHAMRGDALNVWVEAFTLDHPGGERRDVISPTWGDMGQRVLERAGVQLGGDDSSR